MKREPRFNVLDIVKVSLDDSQDAGRGVVCQVRAYPDGRFRYSIGTLTEAEADLGGIYDEEDLGPTGERSPAEPLTTCGPFHVRDVVLISDKCSIPEVAGRRGIIEGCTAEDESELFVWLEELQELEVINAAELIATGERHPPRAAGPRVSSQVSVAGELLGEETYIVLEDVNDL